MRSIYNKIHTLDVITSRMVTELFAGNYRSSFQGSGIEVEDIRKYEDGDNARNIDWVATAKLGEPYVKKYRETRELSTFIIIDVSPSMRFSSIPNTKKSDTAIEAAAILLFSAVKNGEAVGAIIFSDDVEHFIPPRKGKRHALRILREIFMSYESSRRSKSNIEYALHSFNTSVKKHPICFLITDQDELNETAQKALSIANLKNDFVYLHVSDPFEREITDNSTVLLEDMEDNFAGEFCLSDKRLRAEYKLLRMKKEKKRKDILKRLHIDQVMLSTDGNTFAKLFSFFKRRQKNVRRV